MTGTTQSGGAATTTGSLLIYGAGDHGLVVAESAAAAGWRVLGFLDDGLRAGAGVGAFHVVGPGDSARDHDAAIIIAIGDNRTRSDLLRRYVSGLTATASVVHPAAWVSPSATIGACVFIGPGAVINAEASIADGAIVNSGAVVEHHNRIGESSHIAPGAVLTGRVTVGARTLIGARAVVLPGRTIGDDATIGAGSVVTRDLPHGARVAGNPARDLA